MHPTDNPRFTAAIAGLARQYPGSRWSDDHAVAYWSALSDQPWESVLFAIHEAPVSSPQFIPPAPMLRAMAIKESIRLRAQSAQKTLDGVLPKQVRDGHVDQGHALQEFYRLCDDALSKSLGPEITDDNKHILQGLVIVLGAVYGFDRERMEPYARGLSWVWGPGDSKTGKQLCLDPFVVIRALRKVPGVFVKFPTEGMIRSIVRDEPITAWPDDWLTPNAKAMRIQQREQYDRTATKVDALIDQLSEGMEMQSRVGTDPSYIDQTNLFDDDQEERDDQ